MPSDRSPIASVLAGRVIALPESRQLDLLATLFERRGARVLRTPLVAILDSPDQARVLAWITDFIRATPPYLVILTGEGIRRLADCARRGACLEDFLGALSRTSKICRGPKPGRALRELGLKADLQGDEPTTRGIIAALERLDLQGRALGVQLYGEDPNLPLMEYLSERGARVCPVAPYVYAPRVDAQRVLELIEALALGRVDVIAFTSQPQFARLLQVARDAGAQERLYAGLQRTLVAAVGPVVATQLGDHGVRVHMVPRESFFMKPMVREIERRLEAAKAPRTPKSDE